MRKITKGEYTLEIYTMIIYMGMEMNCGKFYRTKPNGDIIEYPYMLPMIVENYDRNSIVGKAPSLDRYNLEELFEDAFKSYHKNGKNN